MTDHAEPLPPPPRRRWRRWILGGAVLLLLLLLGLLALAPRLLSTGPGTRWLAARVNARIAGTITFESLSLGWGEGQRVQGLSVTDPEGAQVLRAGAITAPDLSLADLVRGGRDLGAVEVAGLDLDLAAAPSGELNLERALAPTEGAAEEADGEEEAAGPGGAGGKAWTFTLWVKGRGRYREPGAEPVAVEDFDLEADLADPGRIAGHATGRLRRGEAASPFRLEGRLADALDARGGWHPGDASVELDGNVRGVPVSLVDRILDRQGLLVAALGETVDLSVSAEGPLDRLGGNVQLKSPHLEAALGFVGTEEGITGRPGTLRWELTPAAWSHLKPNGAPALAEPAVIRLAAESWALPRREGAMAWEAGRLTARLESERIAWSGGWGGEQGEGEVDLAFDALALELSSAGFGESVTARLIGGVSGGGERGGLEASLTWRELWSGPEGWGLAGSTGEVSVALDEVPGELLDALAGLEGAGGAGGWVQEVLGAQVSGRLEAALAPRRAGGRWMASGPWALELEGPRAGAALAGEIAPEALVVHEGGRVRAEVAPALWARVAGEMTDIRLAAPTSLVLEPAALHVPLTPGGAAGSGTMAIIDLPAVRLGGTLRADRLAVDGLTWPGRWAEAPAEVHELVAVLEPFRLDAAARVDWRARIVRSREGAAPESVAVVGEVTARSLLEDPALVQARGRLDAVPGRWLADLDARAGPWLDAAGGRLEAAEFTLQPQGTGIDWTLGLKAPRFSFEGGGAWEGGVLRLDEGMRLAGSVAPETWERWMGGSGWRLTAPGRVALSFEASHLALDADSNAVAGLDLARTGGGVALALEGFELAGPGGRPRRLGPFELTARGPALTGPLELAFEGGWKGGGERGTEAGEEDGGAPEAGAGGAVHAAPGEEAAPDWRGRVQVSDLLRPDGTLDWEAVAAEAQVSLGRLPVPLIDRIAGADGLLAETLGPEARVALEGAWPGAIALEMHSPRASARLSAHLNREHVLTLAEDAVVEFTVSPGLAEALLKWGNPVLIDASASEEPVVLTAREGFTLPVRNFDIERWAGTLTLQAGSLVLQDSWLLTALAGELGRLGSGLFPWDRRQAVHATPLQVRVKEGRVTTNDMWLTGESLHLGTRGTVDLAARTADFKVGISGWMLRQAKFLRPVIEPDAVYVLHARGPIDKLEPDVGDLVIQLLSLRGRGELTRAAGEWGALLEAGLGALVKGIRQYETEVPWPNRPPPPEVGEAALDGEGEAGEAAEEGAAQKPQEPAPERRDPIKEGLRELFRALE